MAAVWTQSPFDGLAWLVNRRGGSILDSPQRVAAMRIHSTAVETINNLSTYVERIVGTPLLRLDIWPLANLPENLSGGSPYFEPSGDNTMTAATGVPNNTAGQLYQNIDDGGTLDLANYISLASINSSGATIWHDINSSGGLGAGAQNISQVVVTIDYAGDTNPGQVQFGLADGSGKTCTSPQVPVTPTGTPTTMSYAFSAFDDGTPITEAFLVALASAAGAAGVGLSWQALVAGTHNLIVYRMRVQVFYSNETRVVASVLASPTAEGWLTFGPFTNWAKTAQDYVAVVRCLSGGSCVIPTLDSDAAMPSGHRAYDLDVSSAGVVTSLGDLLTEAHPFVMHTTAPAASVDSQPYADLRREQVYLGRTLAQELTPGSTGPRAFVQVVVASAQDALPQAGLVVRLRTTAGGTQQGGDATFDPEDIADEPLTLHVLNTTLASAGTLTSGTQYDIEFSSLTPNTAPWEVVMLDTKTPPLNGSGKGFDGNTDKAKINGVATPGTTTQKLSQANQDLETAGNWGAVGGVGATVARVNSNARSGGWSLNMNHGGAGGTNDIDAGLSVGSGAPAIIGGAIITASGWVKDDGTNHKTAKLFVTFYDAGTVIIGSAIEVASLTTTGAYQQLTGSTVAPSNAAFAAITWRIVAATFGTGNWYADDFSVLEFGYVNDIPAELAATPTTPAGLAAVATNNTVPYITLSWTATGLGGSFAAYVIERLHGTKWWPILRILAEATTSTIDYEAAIGVAEQYRIRVLKTDGTYSVASTPVSATITALFAQVGSLTTNRQPSLNRASELARPLTLEFPREQEIRTSHGARYRTVVSNPTDRGLGIKTKRHTKVSGTSRGFGMFTALRALIDANAQSLPYVCVRDPFGFRAFCALVAEGGNYEIPTYGSADVQLIETSAVPDVVDR